MYWWLGAQILRTAKRIRATPHWFSLHLTNFGCGADSFIEHFYKHIMGDKPSLILELDEHSAAAGVMPLLERLTWRVRPYEKEPGRTDAFVDGAVRCLIATFEKHGSEVVNASMTEWMKYVSYEGLRIARRNLRLHAQHHLLGRGAAADERMAFPLPGHTL